MIGGTDASTGPLEVPSGPHRLTCTKLSRHKRRKIGSLTLTTTGFSVFLSNQHKGVEEVGDAGALSFLWDSTWSAEQLQATGNRGSLHITCSSCRQDMRFTCADFRDLSIVLLGQRRTLDVSVLWAMLRKHKAGGLT